MRAGCSGTLEAVTGFGKTYEAILIIQRLHRKYPDAQIDIVLPGIDLYNDWVDERRGHIAKHQLNNVYPYVVNTYITAGHRPTLLILDEIHHYASNEFKRVFEVSGCISLLERKKGDPFILGLTATMERIDRKHRLIEQYCPIIDTVTLEEAKREGFVSDFIVYNWGLEFNEEDQLEYNKQDSIFKNAFGKFDHNFDMAMACSFAGNTLKTITIPITKTSATGNYIVNEERTKTVNEWRIYWAKQHDWDLNPDSFWSPKNIAKYAQQFTTSMRARKKLIHTASVKIEAIKQLYEKFPVKTIIFSEDTTFADRAEETFGKETCRAYHTKIKSETIREEKIDKKGRISYKDKKLGVAKTKEWIKNLFQTSYLMILATVRQLNEGYDSAVVRLAVMASYNSSKRDDTQRTGRAIRLDVDDIAKKAIVVNLYIIDSQEEKWLKEKQKGKQGIVWVNSIEQINLQQLTINLANVE